MQRPTKRSALECLTRERLIELGHAFELEITTRMKRDDILEVLAPSRRASFEAILDELKRDELKEICRAHALEESGKSKATFVERILGRPAANEAPKEAQTALAYSAGATVAKVLELLDPRMLAEVATNFGFAPERVERDREKLIAEMAASAIPLDELLDELSMDSLRTLWDAFCSGEVPRRRADVVRGLTEQQTGTGREPASPARATKRATPAAPASATAARREPTPMPTRVTYPKPRSRRPSVRGLLRDLKKQRLVELGRTYQVSISPNKSKDELVDAFVRDAEVEFADLLRHLDRDELRAACERYGLPSEGRARKPLMDRLLSARSDTAANDSVGTEAPAPASAHLPAPKDIVTVRRREYLVEEVVPPPGPDEGTLVKMVCLDDDAPGRRLEVIWELELGAKVTHPETGQIKGFTSLDAPRHFAAYLHALKWNQVTATDAKLFQAPFRAGIKLEAYQLTPLMKALELPRANLFIADDVGLGKTIEAGLVLQELLLRQQVDYVLIVAPPGVCLQWQDEMWKRFGLQFEVYDRQFVARRRRERGFAVNPWMTHNRFIISYPLLRRPEYLEPLIAHLGDRKRKSLLILDEAHTVAPASAARYAVDSAITHVIRDQLAHRFDNRLFLSATPHNGHSNSFSALLEILDPQRFTRGVPITKVEQLLPVMIRRLKRDIREVCDAPFPERKVVEIELSRQGEEWLASERVSDQSKGGPATPVGTGPAIELQLAELLRDYTELMQPRTKRAKLALVGLQKRLLSSVAAFARTLAKHVETFERSYVQMLQQDAPKAANAIEAASDDDIDPTDEALAISEDSAVAEGSRGLAPEGHARALLEQMVRLAARGRSLPDARVHALIEWLKQNLCPAIGFSPERGADRSFTNRRVLIFTESVDTKRYLKQLLSSALSATDRGDERILEVHGGMPDDLREEVQRAFNDPEHPVRILLATDAAREGINLQGQCADLFHFDIPWNPSRMEQRNGRIDRTLQQADTVHCHYFRYRDRDEDVVLQAIVAKVETIAKELGSLGEVVHQQLAKTLEDGGITRATIDAVQGTTAPYLEGGAHSNAIRGELETIRNKAFGVIKKEVQEANRRLVRSRKRLDFDNALLRDTLDVGLTLMGHEPLTAITAASAEGQGVPAYRLPALPSSWDETLDALRPPKARDEAPWEWRKRPPQPVVFEAPSTMTSPRVHLHLHHPFVRRVMDRFLAQGTGAHDLQRVTVVRDADAEHVWVLAFGRLSLFGHGAVRLHDELVCVAAPWDEEAGPKPGSGDPKEDQRVLDRLETLLGQQNALRPVSKSVARDVVKKAGRDFAQMWPAVQDEVENAAHRAAKQLEQRGAEESAALRKILEEQRAAISKTLAALNPVQLELTGVLPKIERAQVEADRTFMERRLKAIDAEIATETSALQQLYDVQLRRLSPVGMIYLWPEGLA